MSPIAAFEAIEGGVKPDTWIHAFMAKSAPKDYPELLLLYLALIPRAHDRLSLVGSEPAAATPFKRLIETWAA
jgi:hypothetical protein